MQVQVTVSRTAFADALGAMREWLDCHGCPDLRFETATQGDGILISIDFSDDGLAAAFRQTFDPLAAAA
jgi:hypothetical protein